MRRHIAAIRNGLKISGCDTINSGGACMSTLSIGDRHRTINGGCPHLR
jgi:hypothetical protein